MSRFKPALYYQLGSLCLLALVLVLVARYVPVLQTVSAIEQKLGSAGRAGPLIYPLIIAAFNLLLMPGGVLSFGGGLFFGLWWGFLLVLTGNLLAAAGAFWIARILGRKRVERLLHRRAKWAHLDELIERDGWKIVLLSQVHPLFPVSLINYIYGITSIRFWPCLMWTCLGRVPAIFLYVYLGTLGQFGINLMQGRSQPRMVEYLFWGSGLLLLVVLTVLLGRLATRLLAEAEAKAERGREHGAAMVPSVARAEAAEVAAETKRVLVDAEAAPPHVQDRNG